MSATPEALFRRYRTTGHPEPLGELFDRCGPQLLALALHRCGHPADAEDALQATFVAAIDQRHRWNAQRPLLPWLGGILDNQCRRIGQRRARRREQQLPDEPLQLEDGTPLAASERAELVAQVRQHLDRLPAEQRQVLLLQLEHGLAPAEVAEVLGVPPGTVRMRLHRGVLALRSALPAGLIALVLAALPSRGVAAVRAAVVSHAVAGLTVGGGMVLAKKAAGAAVVALVLSATAMWAPWWSDAATGSAASPVAPASVAAALGPTATSSDAPAAPPLRRDAVVLPAAAPSTPAATGSLRIAVVDEHDRRPVPHLPLQVFRPTGDDDSLAYECAVSGDDGFATFAAIPVGRVRVVAAAGSPIEGDVRAGEQTTLALLIAAVACPVRGVVRHPDGRPAPGATIVVGPPYSGYAEPVGLADGGGCFALELPRASLAIGARLTGNAASEMQFVDGRDAPIEILLLGDEANVDGLVVDADGTPVAGARVEIGTVRRGGSWSDEHGRHFERTPPRRLRTAVDGRFRGCELRAGEIGVAVRADGFAPFHRYVTLVAGASNPVRCELAGGTAVHGRVVDQRGGAVAGASVSFGGSYGERRTTDAAGRFAYRSAPRGPQQIRVEGDDVVTRHVERDGAVTSEWVVEVERALRYRLRFVDEASRPLVEWQVRLCSAIERTATTDADGRVTLCASGVESPRLLLGSPDDLQPSIEWAWPDAVPDVERTIVVPDATIPIAGVHGQLADADGQPFAGAWLDLLDSDGRIVRRCGAVPARFEVRALPAGDFVLAAAREQIGFALARVPIRALRRGEVRDLGVLRLPREGAVQVNVFDAAGRVARDAHVFLWNDAHQESRLVDDGNPTAVPVGSYRWQVMHDDSLWQRGTLVVRAGETTSLDVVLRPGVRRYLAFPVPTPDWGAPKRVEFVLRAPDGSVYDASDFDPREELPYRYMPALDLGRWQLELCTDDGRRFTGAFAIDSLAPSRTPIDVALQPSR